MMTTTTADLIHHIHRYLHAVETQGEEIAIIRDSMEIARLVPGPSRQTASQVLGDIYGTLTKEAAEGWLADSRSDNGNLDEEIRNPWDT